MCDEGASGLRDFNYDSTRSHIWYVGGIKPIAKLFRGPKPLLRRHGNLLLDVPLLGLLEPVRLVDHSFHFNIMTEIRAATKPRCSLNEPLSLLAHLELTPVNREEHCTWVEGRCEGLVMSTRSKSRECALVILLSLVGGLITAYTYTVTLDNKFALHTLTLPAVFPIATVVGLIGGVIVSPFLYMCLRGKNKAVAVPSIYAIVAIVTACLNLTVSGAGLLGSFAATFAVLLIWRRIGPDAEEDIAVQRGHRPS